MLSPSLCMTGGVPLSAVKRLTVPILACLVSAVPRGYCGSGRFLDTRSLKDSAHSDRIPSLGPPEVTQLWEGIFARSRDGSQLQKLKCKKPHGVTDVARFVDRPNGRSYNLHYSTRTAVLSQDNMPGRDNKMGARRRLRFLGRQAEVLRGITCFVIPGRSTTPGVTGRGCCSPEYDLHLYREIDVADGAGTTVRHRDECCDLEIGRASDGGKVELPAGFVVQEALCSSC